MRAGATTPEGPTAAERPHWIAFGLVCLAYLGVTVGEQALSPVMPGVAPDLGLDAGDSGIAFGSLAAAIAAGNLVGGAFLGRLGARRLMFAGLACTSAGGVVAATAGNLAVLVVGQLLLGLGAGLYFPGGLQAVAALSSPGRRGFAMGIYGVAFSGGLTVAALLGTLGAASGWRWAFWATSVLGAAAGVATLGLRLAPADGSPISLRFPGRAVLGLPTFIGAVGSVCQYGAIPFLTTFAVAEWGLGAGAAAALLGIGRVMSIVAKLVSGASTDRLGPLVSARRTGVVLTATGLAWVLLPGGWVTYVCAVVFAGWVSSLFPIANLVAVDRFGRHGPALGAYRSAQIGFGAVAGWLIGRLGVIVGLRATLAVAVATPILLALVLHRFEPPTRPETTQSRYGADFPAPGDSESLGSGSTARTDAKPQPEPGDVGLPRPHRNEP
jgi:DHA1 family inner membrane transport protein